MKYFACTIALGAVLCASTANSQTFKTLVQFTGTGGTASGATPFGSLVVSGTTLYGMTSAGGTKGVGNIFSVGVDGTSYQNLLSFTGTTGAAIGDQPGGSLTLSGSTLYGMTNNGGTSGKGNVFSIATNGTGYQNLLSFTGAGGTASGWNPNGDLTISGTTLYGMTSSGGSRGYGNIFSVGSDGTSYQNLVTFTNNGGTADGVRPLGSLLLNGTTLYGMTFEGGSGGAGTIFSVGTDGTNYRDLFPFTGGTATGAHPNGDLTLSGTTLYGMTQGDSGGGFNGIGKIVSVGTDGTNYQNLASFTGTSGSANGATPFGSLLLSGTTLYGMTYGGGRGLGNIFSVGIDGSGFHDLYDFDGTPDSGDGASPYGNLILSGGTLFGMTSGQRTIRTSDGTVFALTLPTPTPEPGTLALVGCGAAALVSYRWRRRRGRKRR